MKNLIKNSAAAIAALGVVLTVVSGLARLMGIYYFGHFQAMTVFTGGMGLMLIGIVGQLHVLTQAR